MSDDLPIYAVLPRLLTALEEGAAVLVAPPGAGKTTAVAPALLHASWCQGTVILTSPRRVAARAAAERMSERFGEPVGGTVGYATRLDSRRGADTRILVVTEAILLAMLLDDAELAGVSAVLLDEAHERHLDTDVALALLLETRAVLRPDLRLAVMSATIDGARFAAVMGDGVPVIESAGRSHPLRIVWRPVRPREPLPAAMAEALAAAWRETEGDVLAFLPGVREIERTQDAVAARLPGAVVLPLHGQIDPAGQRAAIRRDPAGRRRIVLATAIAETSLTLDGVSVVVDAGLARHAEYDRAAGTSHLVTRTASRAAAEQRAGRAARQGPGTAYRLWAEAAHGGRPAYDPPQIAVADLSGMTLRLARWSSHGFENLALLDPPPAAALAAARAELSALGALDGEGRLTATGAILAVLPLEPREAAMLHFGARHGTAATAGRLALLLQDRNLGGRGEDLAARLARWNVDRSAKAKAARALADRWTATLREVAASSGPADAPSPGVLLAAARPGFVAKARDGSGERWLSASGRGYVLDPSSPLARSELIVIGDAQGSAQGPRVTAALPLTLSDYAAWFPDRIVDTRSVRWNGERVEAIRERRLGAIVLSQGSDPAPDPAVIEAALMQRALGQLHELLPPDLVARARHAGLGALAPDCLRDSADRWLAPLLAGRRDLSLPKGAVTDALLGLLDWPERQRLDSAAPTEFVSPAGTRHRIDYTGDDAPSVEVRVQAMFGLDSQPVAGHTPLLLKLTSPAGRPVQATRDLPGFWRGSWADVRREMKGRYPKHRWPEEPWNEAPGLHTRAVAQRGGSARDGT